MTMHERSLLDESVANQGWRTIIDREDFVAVEGNGVHNGLCW